MTSLVFVIGVFIGVQFLSYSCEGKINLPPRGDTFIVQPGTSRVEIAWTFDDRITATTARQWWFVEKNEVLAATLGNENVTYGSSISIEYEILKPATLVLKNVNDSYNGTYEFLLISAVTFKSSVTVFIAAKPTVTINCSSPITVSEGDDVRCLCKGDGGNPPANVTWYKDKVQIDVAEDERKLLTLNNIDKTTSGTYKCAAQSHTLEDEKSIEIFVYYPLPPTVISFSSTPEKSKLGQSVVISCETIAVPTPSYTIIHNNTEVVGTEKTYIINVVDHNDIGSYKCIAKNKLGNSSKNYHLSVVVLATRTTDAPPNTKIYATEKAACSTSKGGSEWYIILVSLLPGVVIGILFSCIFVCSYRQFRNRKPQSTPVPESSKTVSSIYQDLDLTTMKSEDNYQSLRVGSGTNDADYENENDATYMELNKVRDVENNYQSLT